MVEITVSNTEGRILEDLTDALAAARLNGELVFRAVDVTASESDLRRLQLAGPTPKAMVQFAGAAETATIEDRRHGMMAFELWIVARLPASCSSAQRITEVLRLTNLAKNAVESTPPADAVAGGEPDHWRPRLQWGRPVIEATDHAPWVVGRMPLDISYTLNSPTSH
jgi:hypothetical protein